MFFSCNNYEDNHSSEILNKKEFIAILIEIHKSDALLTEESLFDNKLSFPDSLSYYNYVFKKFNTTREIFHNTMYFYLNDMDKFIEIQKIVVDSLNAKFVYLDSIEKISLQSNDLWDLKREWSLPDDGVTNAIPFNVKTSKEGKYTLSAKVLSYADDLSKDLKLKLIVSYSDTTFDKQEIKLQTKRAEWKDYTITVQSNPNKKIEHIEGEVISHANTTTYMHLKVKDIMLTYKPYEDATEIDTIEKLK